MNSIIATKNSDKKIEKVIVNCWLRDEEIHRKNTKRYKAEQLLVKSYKENVFVLSVKINLKIT